jgi:membrane protease YdiL (CAAX protease family)
LKRRGLAAFFALTFGYPWALGIAYALFPHQLKPILGTVSITNPIAMSALCAPSLAAIVVALAMGRESTRDLFARVTRLRVGWRWYAMAVFPIAAMGLGGQFAASQIYGIPAPHVPEPGQWLSTIATGLIMFFPGPVGEELGWQGFALPRLLERYNGRAAAIIVGVVWGAWHLPAFIIEGMPQTKFPLWAFMVTVVSVSVIITWIVGQAKGSILPAIVGHWSFNCFTNGHAPAAAIEALLFATAAAIIVISGARIGPRSVSQGTRLN